MKHTLAVVIDEPLSLVVQGEGRSERQPSPSSDKGQTSEIEGTEMTNVISKTSQREQNAYKELEEYKNKIAALENSLREKRKHFGAIPKWIFQAMYSTETAAGVAEVRISRDAVALYGWMQARYGGLPNGVFPGKATLAKEMDASESSIHRWLSELYYAGAISIESPHPPVKRTCSYILEEEQQPRPVRPLKESMKNR